MEDDLTASHWDDVLSPSNNDLLVSNHFHSLALDDPYRDPSLRYPEDKVESKEPKDGEEEDEEAREDSENFLHSSQNTSFDNSSQHALHSPENLSFVAKFPPSSLVSEYRQEERRQKREEIVNQLTSGLDTLELDASTHIHPKVDSNAALFADRGSPIKVDHSSAETPLSPTRAALKKATKLRTKRFRKYPLNTIATHLDGDSTSASDPLFSSGSSKSTGIRRASQASDRQKDIVKDMEAPLYDVATVDAKSNQFTGTGLIEREDYAKDGSDLTNQTTIGSNQSYPIQNTSSEYPTKKKLPQRDVITLAPNDNHLKVSVGDPVKVGDITTAHIVYVIRTVNENPESEFFPTNEASVSRRYRDFRWIFHQLQNNHPGKIIPPPPAKQTYIGRFNENFVENRRLLLEKMIAKICRIPCLANDPDLVMFLTSEDFVTESKEREYTSGSAASHASLGDEDNDSPAPSVVTTSGGSQGFLSSLFSIAPKVTEPDEFFARKKGYIEDLEFNLKTFYKSLEMIAAQRVESISVIEELAATIEELADVEILKKTTDLLSAFAELHTKLKENLDRVNLQDQLTLGFTIEEYLRIIGSVKYTFETRTRVYNQLFSFQQELAKKEESLEKLTSRYKSSVDKINMLKFEVDKLQQKVAYFDNSFCTISDTIRSELDIFETEKIDDFRNSVEIFIESSIELQKESIELWETFYERHNLASV